MKTLRLAAFLSVLSGLAASSRAQGVPTRSTELTPRQIYQTASPAVVLLMCLSADGNGELGTGSVIDETGRILTNAHVVIRGSSQKPYERIRVYFKPARLSGDPKQDLVNAHEARVVAWDRALDLAVIELESAPPNLKLLPIGDDSTVEAGEPVVAIGHPEQGGLWTLTQGVVSTVVSNLGGVKGKNVFQTDASINRGNSGGPLISRNGAMIGVNTSMARKAADGLTITSVNFSVKSSVVKNWLASAGVKTDYVEMAAPTEMPDTPGAPLPQKKPSKPAKKSAESEAPSESAPGAEPEPKVSPAQPPSKPAILTPKKPFKIDDMIAREMEEMDDLEKEMREEVEKRRGAPEFQDPRSR